jgi:hypothetical protein
MFSLPNLIIPGAAKSATTSLTEYFRQHKDFFIPKVKEPRFFIAETIRNLPVTDPFRDELINHSILTKEAYENLYKEAGQAKYRCDASVHYLYYHNIVIPEIKKYIGDPHVIIILRNPVERAFSNYTYLKAYDNHSFEEGIQYEKQRKQQGWNSFWFHTGQGFYYEPVKHYLSAFPKVKVVLMDDFKKNGDAVMREIFDFLEVPPIDIDTTIIHNKSGVPPNKFIEWLVFKDNFLKRMVRPYYNKRYDDMERARFARIMTDKFIKKGNITMTDQTHNDLVDLYTDDILKLQDLIQKDVSSWLVKK